MNRLEFLQSAAVIGAGAASGQSWASPPPGKSDWNLWEHSPALPSDHPIDLEMELLDAGREQLKLSNYRGRAVLLNIFATWCPPCKAEQPLLNDVAARYADRGLAVVGMDSRDPDRSVRQYRDYFRVKYPIAMDRNGGVAQVLQQGRSIQSVVYPVSIFFTPGGFVYGIHTGGFEEGELEYRVKRLLNDVSPELELPSPSPQPTPR